MDYIENVFDKKLAENHGLNETFHNTLKFIAQDTRGLGVMF